MFKKLSVILGSFLLLSSAATAVSPSKRIETAVDAFSPLAKTGVSEFKVKPAASVKAALYALAIKEGYSTDESDFSWVGDSSDAWEADSTHFGETTMKAAYSYIMSPDSDADVNNENTPEARAAKKKAAADLKAAKEAFKLLIGSGVQFGVVPMGAVQCGVTFAALAIIDPATGKIYVFAKEGSGC